MKSWDASIHGTPPTGGGGGNGTLKNVTISSVVLDQVETAVLVTQTNDAESGDTPSYYQFSDITYANWTGTTSTNTG
jgi:galacturan 1,4-alpha-galacturonidase